MTLQSALFFVCCVIVMMMAVQSNVISKSKDARHQQNLKNKLHQRSPEEVSNPLANLIHELKDQFSELTKRENDLEPENEEEEMDFDEEIRTLGGVKTPAKKSVVAKKSVDVKKTDEVKRTVDAKKPFNANKIFNAKKSVEVKKSVVDAKKGGEVKKNVIKAQHQIEITKARRDFQERMMRRGMPMKRTKEEKPENIEVVDDRDYWSIIAGGK